MISLFSQKIDGLCECLPNDWQEKFGFVSDCFWQKSCEYDKKLKQNFDIILCGACSSTFAVSHHLLLENSLPFWGSVLALQQWQGKGQQGRSWHSPLGNIYASLRLPTPSKEWDVILSLLCGYCLQQSFVALGFSALLKWPNDILLGGQKVAGLLLEERNGEFLLGIGVNVATSPKAADLRADTSILATNIFKQCGRKFFVLPLWFALVSYFSFCYQRTVLRETPAVFLTHLKKNLAFLGERVSFFTGEKHFVGIFEGLTSEGGVLLTNGTKTQVFFSGTLLPII